MAIKTQSIILTQDDVDNYNTVAAKYPLASRHRIAQAIFRYGLKACVRRPELVLAEDGASQVAADSSDRAVVGRAGDVGGREGKRSRRTSNDKPVMAAGPARAAKATLAEWDAVVSTDDILAGM